MENEIKNDIKKDLKKAVAVKYDKNIDVPIIMAKGEGRTAEKIILEAKEADIFITEDKNLVDLMGLQEVGCEVPENAWYALARIFAFIMDRK